MPFPSPPEAFLEWSQIFAGLGTVILTVFLVILYKKQQEQLAANHEAILEVTDVSWDGDEATVRLSNFGNGVAQRIGLTTLVYADTGGHRKYTARTNMMKRKDKGGEWGNIIKAGEEEVEFTGRSKVGWYIADRGFSGTKFSSFIRRMKEEGATEVKYLHVLRGYDLAGNGCFDTVYWGTRAVNPQDFDRKHSLDNLPGYKVMTDDTTFAPYLYPSVTLRIRRWLYVRVIYFLNWFIPKYTFQPRALDASGRKRVKRMALRHRVKKLVHRIRSMAPKRASNSD